MSIDLLPSAARTDASGSGETILVPPVVRSYGGVKAAVFTLDVTAAATEAGDTLDVFVQTRIDGENWLDVVAFTQVTGDGGAKRHVGKIAAGLAESMFEASATLSAGSVRHLIGDAFRARYAITDASTDNASFTFSVTMQPMY